MIIECDSCEVRGHACGDCVIGVLLGTPAPRESDVEDENGMPSGAPIVQLDAPEQRAFDVLAEQGLVPRLRLVATRTRRDSPEQNGGRPVRDAG
ncbi:MULTISPECIES: hypothetical protein [unclassified Pseudonocardia]|uniref:hypothetical protein n=1 Tax=unclassified Pseudonocardia TaxID=2619320 RepID=UPI0009617AC4|nr:MULTISPECIES: hypothetical protein [unclassified Pseudonocardia]MBN9100375.1 hypothetical protein [Pseudonocardia sp.]OJY50123.1 MAG: hypothetical protein BGP03_24990 [Pseudonocardia sp. 73-21]